MSDVPRKHKRHKLDNWRQIHPANGQPFCEKEFIVFSEDGELYFVANEILGMALGIKGYHRKLNKVPEDEKMRKRVQRGSVPLICISERGLQRVFDTIRFSDKKRQLIFYLNTNYHTILYSNPKIMGGPTCDRCLYLSHCLRESNQDRMKILNTAQTFLHSKLALEKELRIYKDKCATLEEMLLERASFLNEERSESSLNSGIVSPN